MFNKKLTSSILNGTLKGSNYYLAGTYQGYHIVMESPKNQYLVKIAASSEHDPENMELHVFMRQQKEHEKNILAAQADAHMITFEIKATKASKAAQTINDIVTAVIHHLIRNNYVSGCFHCGTVETGLDVFDVNGDHQFLCPHCVQEIEDSLVQNKERIKSQKSHLMPGLVGAFLGSLIGCVLWVLIYKLGYIAGIAGAVSIICALKGYEFLGKHLDVKGVFSTLIITIIMIYFANKLSITWDLYDVLKEYDVTFFDVYHSLLLLLKEFEIVGAYFGDLAIGYILTLLCSFGSIKQAFSASSGSYTLKKEK